MAERSLLEAAVFAQLRRFFRVYLRITVVSVLRPACEWQSDNHTKLHFTH